MKNLEKAFGGRLKHHENLAPYTYIKIGGPAEYFLIAESLADLSLAVTSAHADHLPVTVFGSASNVCISDTGLKGLVIINRAQNLTFKKPNHLFADSGTLISQLVNFTLSHSLSGLASFLGIPGTVGGAIVNNSHHLQSLIGDSVSAVTALTQAGQIQKFNQTDCHFAYDQSVFQSNGAVILSVDFVLEKGDKEKLQALAQSALKRRRDTQPLEVKSSGCMFKNPPSPQLSAGTLIDQAGLKGTKIGGAEVSHKHANFIVNTGNATAADIVALSNLVRQEIYKRHHLLLEREIFFLGNHPKLKV